MKLFLCSGCGRHVKEREEACPFCGAAVSSEPSLDSANVVRRMSRAVLMASASTAVALASCSAYGAPSCPDSVSVSSPCEFISVTTRCAGAAISCNKPTLKTACTIAPIDHDCEITVVLGDATRHTIQVTTGPGASYCHNHVVLSPSSNQDFASSTCVAHPPTSPDATPEAGPEDSGSVESGGQDVAND